MIFHSKKCAKIGEKNEKTSVEWKFFCKFAAKKCKQDTLKFNARKKRRMKERNERLILFGFIAVLAMTAVFVKSCRSLTSAARQPAEKSVAVRYTEIPEFSHVENTIFITHYLPEQDKKNIRNFSILYDTIQKISYWVAYPLHEMYLGNSGRTEAWNYDPLVARHLQPRAHRGIQGFDRGHQLPSADRTYSRSGNATTFYFTNMTAQNASLNRGAWASLESKIRAWVARCDTLYVVTGAITNSEIRYASDNDGRNMAAPKYYYKAIAQKRGDNYYTTAYKFENIAPVNQNIDDYQMTVAELEEKTGFVFFPVLPTNAKDTIVAEYWR